MQKSPNKAITIFAILFGLIIQVNGQKSSADIDLISKKSLEQEEIQHVHHHPEFLLSDHPSFLVRYNPLTLIMGSLMWGYQKIVSPQFSSSCLYSPSCSAYSVDLISDYGLFLGIILTTDRLMRCNRLALFDFNSWEVDSKSGKINESTGYYKIK